MPFDERRSVIARNGSHHDHSSGAVRREFLIALSAAPFLGVAGGCGATPVDDIHPLDGAWRRALDVADAGVAGRWFDRTLAAAAALPGSLERERAGNAVTVATPWTGDINDRSFFTAPDYARYRRDGAVKVPFFLQPDSWYRGAAWYQRDVDIPAGWAGKRIELFLERPHWETRVWIDGVAIGRSDALHVPHRHELGAIAPGRHRLTIRVDNRMIVEIGHNGHGVTDHTQGNWNGIAGRIELRATEPAWIDNVELHPDAARRVLHVRGALRRLPGAAIPSRARVAFAGSTVDAAIAWSGRDGRFAADIRADASAGDAAQMAWDEHRPVLQTAAVTLANGETWRGRFGWRDFAATAHGFRVNGRPAMLRGALECSIFPLSGHPPTDLASWRRIMRRAKAFGLNHLRFHSYCPPEAAFDAADEEGVYVQIETVWANQSTRIGSGLPVDAWVHAETDRVLAVHGNHPSFVMMTHGNEPGGGGTKEGEARRDAFLANYVRHYRARDPRRLWTAGSGWPTIAENQYHVTPLPRIQQWGEELGSRINAHPPETVTDYRDFTGRYAVPVVSHEIGQWCVYPALSERGKYRGYLKAKNFDIFADRLRDSGLDRYAEDFLHASGRLQLLCYKEEIESALRTPGMGGFQLLGLQDFPGQGTALVGVVDPFWDEKGYVTATEYRSFCAPVVPLARLPRRVLRSGDRLAFTVDVANFGPRAIAGGEIGWSIATADGRTMAAGGFPARALAPGNAPLALAAAPLLTTDVATAAALVVTIRESGRIIASNSWDIWVYSEPPRLDRPARHASRIDDRLLADIEAGADVLIGLPPGRVANHADRPVKPGFSSIFWNTLWTERQAPTTLGILCDPRHPALADFPTEAHSNWQWWYLLHRAGALRLDLLPADAEPIVRVIDDWFTARPLGLVVEAAVGRGRVIVCGFEVDGPDAGDPVSRQLVASLDRYMAGDRFRPRTRVAPERLRALEART